ncbi:MAG: GTP 3',8-cyclase MoaA [Planctomycetota bacterium]
MSGAEVTTGRGLLIDRFGRVHRNLRVSVTDRCNIRCFYCMPAENVPFRPKAELLTYEEITRVVRVAASLGVRRVRLTGGEPLVRRDLPTLVAMLRNVDGLEEVSVTTNGILLADMAGPLRRAGVDRLNVSLDALDAEAFRLITRRGGYERVIEGIDAAIAAGFTGLKVNAVAIKGVTETQAAAFGRFARERDVEVRFIEFMPLDADGSWDRSQVLEAAEIRRLIEAELPPLVPAGRRDAFGPAEVFEFADGVGRIGFIASVSEPFCAGCDRFRLTADGQIRNCLFASNEFDVRGVIRSGECGDRIDTEVAAVLREAVAAKKAGHGIGDSGFAPPERAMYAIGG